MNGSISKFAEQCRTLHRDGNGQYVEQFDEEKFAELIIKECLSNMQNCDGDLDFAIWKTKKDFGVEE